MFFCQGLTRAMPTHLIRDSLHSNRGKGRIETDRNSRKVSSVVVG